MLARMNRTTAALMPSCDVPDISPTRTSVTPRRRVHGFTGAAPSGTSRGESRPRAPARRRSASSRSTPQLLHHDSRLDAASRRVGAARAPARDPRRTPRAGSARCGPRAWRLVDCRSTHDVAVRLAQPDHRARGDGVQHELGGGAGPSCAVEPVTTSGTGDHDDGRRSRRERFRGRLLSKRDDPCARPDLART